MAHKRSLWHADFEAITQGQFSVAKRSCKRGAAYAPFAEQTSLSHTGPLKDAGDLRLAFSMAPHISTLALYKVSVYAKEFSAAFNKCAPPTLRCVTVGFANDIEDVRRTISCSSLVSLTVDGFEGLVTDAGPFDPRSFGSLTDLRLERLGFSLGFAKVLADHCTSLRWLALHYVEGSLEAIDDVLRMPLLSFRTDDDHHYDKLVRLENASRLAGLEVDVERGCGTLWRALPTMTALRSLALKGCTATDPLAIALPSLPPTLRVLQVKVMPSHLRSVPGLAKTVSRPLSHHPGLVQFGSNRPDVAAAVLRTCPGVVCVTGCSLSEAAEKELARNRAIAEERCDRIGELACLSLARTTRASRLPLDCWTQVLSQLPGNFCGGWVDPADVFCVRRGRVLDSFNGER